MKKEDLLKKIKQEKIKYLQAWFTDINGDLKRLTICQSKFHSFLEDGINFDGSSITGFANIEDSDLLIKPDLNTFRIIPWKEPDFKTAVLICDVYNCDGSDYKSSPRYILKKELKKIEKLNYKFFIGPELEYFYFNSKEDLSPIDNTNYFDGYFQDTCEEVREKTVKALEEVGIEIECHHHEVAAGQHEITLKYDEALAMADKVIFYKAVVKKIAEQNELVATFMPKPIITESGSGMHVHQSLFKDGENIFYSNKDEAGLSTLAKSYITGLLKHTPEISAVLNPSINSYKRLVPGFESPVYLAWAQNNRTALIRVPACKPESKSACRVELRSPDPSSNPYLAFALMLASGMDGIINDLKETNPVNQDIFKMTDTDRESQGIKSLPKSLEESLEIFKSSKFTKSVLGENLFKTFIQEKSKHIQSYNSRISHFELEQEF